MKNKLLIILLLITFCNSALGKNKEWHSREDTTYFSMSNRLWDNWDIGVAGGISVYFGEEDSKGDFLKRLSPSLEVAATKKVTPVVSFRGLASVGVVNGWYRSTTPLHPYDGELHHESFNLATVQLHALFNVSHAIWGYNEKRKYNIIPFIGTGAAHPWGGGRNNRELIFLAGILNNIYLTPKLDLTVELRHLLVNPRMNYVFIKGKMYEGMGTLSVGLSYKFGKNRAKTSKAVSEQNHYRITNKDLFMNYPNQKKVKASSIKEESVPLAAASMVKDTVCVTPPLLIFFPINQATLDDNELTKIDQYMRYVLRYISNKEFKLFNLDGHADKATGNREINQELSERRVDVVRCILMEKYDIPLNRIVMKAEGDMHNLFEKASPNRVVILQ